MTDPVSTPSAWLELMEGPVGTVRAVAAAAFSRAKQDPDAAIGLLPTIVVELIARKDDGNYYRHLLEFLTENEFKRP